MNAAAGSKESIIRGCNGQVELVSVVDLLDRACGDTPREYFERHVLHDPTLRLRDTRILLRNDRIVSTVQIFPRVMQVAGMELPFGGVGNMATEPSERRTGCAAVMMNDAIDEMRAEGFPLSMLTTTLNTYYQRFGYRTVTRDVAIIPAIPGTIHPAVRRYRRETDFARVKELYRSDTMRSIGPVVRDDLYWEAQFSFCGEDPAMFLVLEEGGVVAAYVRARVHNQHIEIMEYASEHPVAPNFNALLLSLYALAPGIPVRLYYPEGEREKLHLPCPPTVRKDTDLMILVLDNRIASSVEHHLMKPNVMRFWQTDLF